MKLKSTYTPDGDLFVELCGEMDAEGCAQISSSLEQVVDTAQGGKVALDLNQVSFLDSSGIGAIVFLYKRLKIKKQALEIVGVQGQPLELIKLLRIDSAIPVSTVQIINPLQEVEICAV